MWWWPAADCSNERKNETDRSLVFVSKLSPQQPSLLNPNQKGFGRCYSIRCPSTSTMRSFGVPMVLESVITSSFLSPESCSASRRSSERGWDVPFYEQNQTARAHWYLIPFRRAIWVPSRLCEFPCRKLHRNPKKCQGTRTPWVSPQVPCNTATIGSDVQTQ